MNILVVNPNTSPEMTRTIEAALADFDEAVCIDVRNVPWGPLSVESEADNIIAASAVIDTVWNAKDKYDGFVIACFDDPGLEACRELVPQPVVGIGASALLAAKEAVERVGVIVVDTRVVPRVAAHCARNGLDSDRVLFGSLDGTVVELNADSAEVAARFAQVADDLLARGAQCLVLACAGFSDQAGRLERRTGVPVFDGNLFGAESVRRLVERGHRNTDTVGPQPFTGDRTGKPAWSATAGLEERAQL